MDYLRYLLIVKLGLNHGNSSRVKIRVWLFKEPTGPNIVHPRSDLDVLVKTDVQDTINFTENKVEALKEVNFSRKSTKFSKIP